MTVCLPLHARGSSGWFNLSKPFLVWCALLTIPVPASADGTSQNETPLVRPLESDSPGPTEGSLEADFRRARDVLRASPEFQGDGADAHHRLGQVFHHRGDMNGALEEYRLAIQRDLRFVAAYHDLGALLLDRHDYAGAVTALDQAVQLGRRDGETYYWLGRGLLGMRN